MAIATGTVFEVRATATAGMLNSGGFNPLNAAPGVDYSLQDAAQYNATDLASSNATGATPNVTSASHTFTADDRGNLIHITAGTNWLPGWYEIVSISGGGAVLDRACGSAASVSSGTYYVGGALSFGSTLDDDFFDSFVTANGGVTIWIKLGSYTLGESVTMPAGSGGTAAKMNRWIGYKTTRGDACNGDDRPVIVCAAANLSGSSSPNWHWKNIILTGTGASVLTGGTGHGFENVKVVNLSATADRNGLNIGITNSVDNCEFISIRGRGLNVGAAACVENSYFHSSANGLAYSANATISKSIFAGNVTAAINNNGAVTGRSTIRDNTIYGAQNKRGIGLTLLTGSIMPDLKNNSFYGFVTGHVMADTPLSNNNQDRNNYNNNTANLSVALAGANDTTADPGYSSNILLRTGATATVSGSVLTQTGATFSTWSILPAVNSAPKFFVRLVSGTGVTAGFYGISSLTETTLTLTSAPGDSAGGDVVWEIVQVTANGFLPNSNLQRAGEVNNYPLGFSQGVNDIGAVQTNGSDFFTDPDLSKIDSAYSFKYNTVGANNRTGTATIPTLANTKTGVAGYGGTGTYDGTDRHTHPTESQVLNGVAWKDNSTSNNKTGNVTQPAEADVEDGVLYGANGTQFEGSLVGGGGTNTYIGRRR